MTHDLISILTQEESWPMGNQSRAAELDGSVWREAESDMGKDNPHIPLSQGHGPSCAKEAI